MKRARCSTDRSHIGRDFTLCTRPRAILHKVCPKYGHRRSARQILTPQGAAGPVARDDGSATHIRTLGVDAARHAVPWVSLKSDAAAHAVPLEGTSRDHLILRSQCTSRKRTAVDRRRKPIERTESEHVAVDPTAVETLQVVHTDVTERLLPPRNHAAQAAAPACRRCDLLSRHEPFNLRRESREDRPQAHTLKSRHPRCVVAARHGSRHERDPMRAASYEGTTSDGSW